ncbi:MAG TPA: hypothetical protein VFS20_31750 [Longimicrobium sp.]|nr:hypothetical protein [Longimicrobium sp.]
MPPVSLTARAVMTCPYGLGAPAREPPLPLMDGAAAPPEGAVAAAGAPVRGAGGEEGRAAGAHEFAATAAAARETNQSLLRTMSLAGMEKIADVDAANRKIRDTVSWRGVLDN